MHCLSTAKTVTMCAWLALLGGCDGGAAPSPDAAPSDVDPVDEMPPSLADTGLFASGSGGTLAPGVEPYEPRYALWADGADKQRWLRLPPGTLIDTTDMDHWRFPVGTKVWKEFSRAGRKLETRLLWKTARRWVRLAYEWNATGDGALLAANRGSRDVLGTEHDVPARAACDECHKGVPDQLLGVGAVQLSHDGPGVTLQGLVDRGLLTQVPGRRDFRMPDDVTWNALGYLHANCGNCHLPTSITWDRLDLDLWLRTAQLDDAHATSSVRSLVGVPLTDSEGELSVRIAPGAPESSGVMSRMALRGDDRAMPPIASERADEVGLATVQVWIESL